MKDKLPIPPPGGSGVAPTGKASPNPTAADVISLVKSDKAFEAAIAKLNRAKVDDGISWYMKPSFTAGPLTFHWRRPSATSLTAEHSEMSGAVVDPTKTHEVDAEERDDNYHQMNRLLADHIERIDGLSIFFDETSDVPRTWEDLSDPEKFHFLDYMWLEYGPVMTRLMEVFTPQMVVTRSETVG